MNAGMKLRYTVTGNFASMLEEIRAKYGVAAVSRIIRKAADIVVPLMKARAPEDTGTLKKSIGLRIRRYKRGRITYAAIGPKDIAKIARGRLRRPTKYSHLVEFGTRPHVLGARNVQHPGARAKPFARPSFEETKTRIAESIIAEVEKVAMA